MKRWTRPYRDWRLTMWYPLLLATPLAAAYSATTYSFSRIEQLVLAFAAGLTTVMIWRITRLGIFLGDDRIKVVNLLRSQVFAIPDIARVEDASGGTGRQIVLVTASGKRIKSLVQTTTHAGYEVYLTNHQYQQLVDLLNKRLRQKRR